MPIPIYIGDGNRHGTVASGVRHGRFEDNFTYVVHIAELLTGRLRIFAADGTLQAAATPRLMQAYAAGR